MTRGQLSEYKRQQKPEVKERKRQYARKIYYNMTPEQKEERTTYIRRRRHKMILCIRDSELQECMVCAFMTGKTSEERGKEDCDE